jgi:hypothetical protein
MFEGNDIAVLQDQWLLFRNITKQRFIKIFHESTWGIGLEMEGSYYQKPFNRLQNQKKCSS